MDAQVVGTRDAPLTGTTVAVQPPAGTASGGPPPYRGQQAEGGDFGDLLRLVWRRKLLLVALVAVAMALCAAAITQIAPVYTARGLVLVDAPRTHIVDLEAVLSGVSAEVDAVESEGEVLRDPALAAAVVAQLSLDRSPEFNPWLRPPTIWEKLRSAGEHVVALLPLATEADVESVRASPQEMIAAERADVVRTVLGGLSVSSRDRSQLLDVAFTSEDPDLAAEIVNTFLKLYISEQVDKKYEATLGATEWLSRNVASWQQRTSESERKIEEFRSQADLLEGEHGALLLRQISEANDQLTAARVARSMAETRLRQVEQFGVDATLSSADEQLRSPLMQRLGEREADLLAIEAEMRAKYGPDHARVVSVQSELRNLRAVMAAEIDRVVRGLKIDLARSRSIEQMLDDSLEQLKRQVSTANLARVDLDALRRQADANRRILEVFTARLAETRGQADRGVLQPDASIIARAAVPLQPSYPKPKLFFALTFVLAVGAGLLFIVLAEGMRRGFCSGDEIERATGMPVLGLLPDVRGRGWFPGVSGLRSEAAPLSQFLARRRPVAVERSVRWLGDSLTLHGDKPRVVLLTSAKSAEGKTTAAVALGRLLARVDGKVVVVEAEVCRPRIHSAFRMPGSPGLRDVLLGAAPLDAVLHRDDESGVYALPAGTAGRQSHGALPWPAIEPLLASLRERFDLIVIDGPPILQAPETRLLSRLADATIFIVQWGRTDRRMVAAGLDQIEQSGGRAAGLLLTMVKARKYARYSHRDSHRFLFDGGRRCAH